MLASVTLIPLCILCLSNEMNGDLFWLFCYSCGFHHCVVFFIHLWVIFWSCPCFSMVVIQTCCSVICFMYTIEWVVFCCSFLVVFSFIFMCCCLFCLGILLSFFTHPLVLLIIFPNFVYDCISLQGFILFGMLLSF